MNNADNTQLNRQIKKRIGDYGEELCHYTSMQAFFSMLSSKELWLSNTSSMNDKEEIVHFIGAIQRELHNYHRDNFFNKVYEYISSHYKYAFCLSTEYDDAAQWERYGDSARGVCIVFDVAELSKCLYGYTDFIMSRMFYDDSMKNNMYCKVVKKYFENGDIPIFNAEEKLISNLLYAGSLHKHHSFKHECEVRITTMENVKQYGIDYKIKEMGSSVNRVLVMKPDIMGFKKGTDFEKMISKVVIGPRSHQNIAILKEYIFSKGFISMPERVTQSDCPLR